MNISVDKLRVREEVPEAWRTSTLEAQAFLMATKRIGGMEKGETFREWDARLSAEAQARYAALHAEDEPA